MDTVVGGIRRVEWPYVLVLVMSLVGGLAVGAASLQSLVQGDAGDRPGAVVLSGLLGWAALVAGCAALVRPARRHDLALLAGVLLAASCAGVVPSYAVLPLAATLGAALAGTVRPAVVVVAVLAFVVIAQLVWVADVDAAFRLTGSHGTDWKGDPLRPSYADWLP